MDLLNQKPEPIYAGFWLRFVARLVDELIIGAVAGFIIVPIAIMFGLSTVFMHLSDLSEEDQLALIIPFVGVILLLVLIVAIMKWLYYAMQESSEQQATLGKRALGIKVTDSDGNRITFARASGRFFGKFISGAIMYVGFIMAAFTEKKQALHDLIADCLVVMK